MTDESKHKVEVALLRLWWIEYDSLGNDFIFDIIEGALREMGAKLPNAEYGGRAPKWGKAMRYDKELHTLCRAP